eukprot:2902788-Rhodomonas_salina.1
MAGRKCAGSIPSAPKNGRISAKNGRTATKNGSNASGNGRNQPQKKREKKRPELERRARLGRARRGEVGSSGGPGGGRSCKNKRQTWVSAVSRRRNT